MSLRDLSVSSVLALAWQVNVIPSLFVSAGGQDSSPHTFSIFITEESSQPRVFISSHEPNIFIKKK